MIEEAIAIDTETTGLRYFDYNQVFAVGAFSERDLYVREFDVHPTQDKQVAKVRYTLEDKQSVNDFLKLIQKYRWWTFFNAKFDVVFLDKLILELFDCPNYFSSRLDRVRCSYIMGHAYDNNMPNSLDVRAERLLDFACPEDTEITKVTGIARGRLTRKGLLEAGDHPVNEGHAFYWCCTYSGKHLSHLETERTIVSRYLTADIERAYILDLLYTEEFKKTPTMQAAYRLNMEAMPAVMASEARGIYVNRQNCDDFEDEVACKARENEIRVQTIVGKPFNIAANVQVADAFLKVLKFPVLKKTKTGGASFDKDAIDDYLEEFNEEDEPFNDYFPKKLKALTGKKKNYYAVKAFKLAKVYAKIGSSVRTYKGFLDHHKLLHPSFKICGTATFRAACATPNLQQAGNKKEWKDEETQEVQFMISSVKSILCPKPGEVMYASDFNQIQLWVFALESGEQVMLDKLSAGLNFHEIVACDLYKIDDPKNVTKEQKRVAKAINFGYIFGAGESKIYRTCGDKEAFKKYSKLYPNAHSYMKSINKFVAKYGYVEFSCNGETYRLYVERNRAYKGVNYIVQGKEGVLVKKAWKLCHDYLSGVEASTRLSAGVSCQVHDELWFSYSKKINHKLHQKRVVELMRKPCIADGIPLAVKTGIIHKTVALEETVCL